MKLLETKPDNGWAYVLAQCARVDRATGETCQTQGWKPAMYGPSNRHDRCEAHFDNSLLRRIQVEADEINASCRCGECGACLDREESETSR